MAKNPYNSIAFWSMNTGMGKVLRLLSLSPFILLSLNPCDTYSCECLLKIPKHLLYICQKFRSQSDYKISGSQWQIDKKRIHVISISQRHIMPLEFWLRGCSQIMSAAEGGVGVWKILTLADKGRRGGQANADNGWHWLTKEGGGVWLSLTTLTKI